MKNFDAPLIVFSDFISAADISSTAVIVDLLLKNTFLIIGNSNSHNYRNFATADGYIKFNNPGMHIDLETMRVSEGCREPGLAGNTLMFSDIALVREGKSKQSIVDTIEFINKQQRELEEDLKKQNKYLEYLVATNKSEMIESEFEEWNKEQIKNSLLPAALAKY